MSVKKDFNIIVKAHSENMVSDYILKVCSKKYISTLSTNEIEKAGVLPGTIKYFNGKAYIYVLTPNAKTDYDWRVYKPSMKTTKVASGVDLLTDEDDVVDDAESITDLFPSELSDVKELNIPIGGSTGAKLVEDEHGNRYVMKRGSNTSNGHVMNEYLATQLYDVMGMKVPQMEIYNDGGEVVLLSKFIPNTREPNNTTDTDLMAKGYIVDALLGNWDIYLNDNCRIAANDDVYRVDNGGSLFYRAKGGLKISFDESLAEYESMMSNNNRVLGRLTNDEIYSQILDALSRKNNVMSFLSLDSGNKGLIKIMEGRFKRLEEIKFKFDLKYAAASKSFTRNLIPESEMYRDLEDDLLNDIFVNLKDEHGGDLSYHEKIDGNSFVGRPMLTAICKQRGFDGLPLVVKEDEYWDEVAKNPKLQCFRGMNNFGSKSAEDYVDQFKFGECYYGGGNFAVYGAGIYLQNNNSGLNYDQHSYHKTTAYTQILNSGYASNKNGIVFSVLEENIKLGDFSNVVKEIESISKQVDSKTKDEIDKLEVQLDNLKYEIDKLDSDMFGFKQKIESDIKSKMHYSNVALRYLSDIDNEDWGAVDAYGDRDYIKYDDFLNSYLNPIVDACNGKITQLNGGVSIKLPNSDETLLFTEYRYNNNAIKQRNQFTKAYSYPVEEFKNFVNNNHFKPIQENIDKAIENSDEDIAAMENELHNLKNLADVTAKDIDVLYNSATNKSVGNPDKDFKAAVYNAYRGGSDAVVGVYAAYLGYDGLRILKDKIGGSSNDYIVLFNRTKLKVKV